MEVATEDGAVTERASILIVEDEEDIRHLLEHTMVKERYAVTAVTSGEEAVEHLSDEAPDVVLLDLMLPGMDGLEVCRRIRARDDLSETAIVMVTARGDETDVVTGLEFGADDYVVKPFSPRVLSARVRAVLRRKPDVETDSDDQKLTFGPLAIWPHRHEVTIAGKPVDLTASEFSLLSLLTSRPGRVFTRGQIIESIHGRLVAVTDRSVDVQVVGLRRKLGPMGKSIQTVRAVGYRFNPVTTRDTEALQSS